MTSTSDDGFKTYKCGKCRVVCSIEESTSWAKVERCRVCLSMNLMSDRGISWRLLLDSETGDDAGYYYFETQEDDDLSAFYDLALVYNKAVSLYDRHLVSIEARRERGLWLVI